MIDKRELKFENLVNEPVIGESRIVEIGNSVAWLDNGNDGGIYSINYINIFPIPLTEEWLIKVGFEKVNHIHGYSFWTLAKSKNNKANIDVYDTKTLWMGYSVNHCKYVHQLQNLYFALTGKELEIKN